jgi:hypothetical protein
MLEKKKSMFQVDGTLLMILPNAVSSLKNPDGPQPILRSDDGGHYLEMRCGENSTSDADGELPITRRIPLDNFTQQEWEQLQEEYSKLNFQNCMSEGVNKSLENIQDRRIQRLFMALLTFLNPRQVAITLYLYRLAAQQENGPEVAFDSNDLLEALGYTRSKRGTFDSKLRSQINQDLVALHRTELVFARSLRNGKRRDALVMVKSILRIKSYIIKNLSRDFDLLQAADYTYELADSYNVVLEFENSSGGETPLLFAEGIDIKQSPHRNSKFEYKMRMITFLASRLIWDKAQNEQSLVISKPRLFKNLALFGSNGARNNEIFWRTVDELKEEGYILKAHEIAGKGKTPNIEIHVNPEKIRLANH